MALTSEKVLYSSASYLHIRKIHTLNKWRRHLHFHPIWSELSTHRRSQPNSTESAVSAKQDCHICRSTTSRPICVHENFQLQLSQLLWALC